MTKVGPDLFGGAIEVEVDSDIETVTALVDLGLAPTIKTAQATIQLNGTVMSTTVDPRMRVVRKMPTVQQEPPIKRWMF